MHVPSHLVLCRKGKKRVEGRGRERRGEGRGGQEREGRERKRERGGRGEGEGWERGGRGEGEGRERGGRGEGGRSMEHTRKGYNKASRSDLSVSVESEVQQTLSGGDGRGNGGS